MKPRKEKKERIQYNCNLELIKDPINEIKQPKLS